MSRSRVYALVQTTLLIAFAGAVFLAPGRPVLPPGGLARGLGAVLSLVGLALVFAALVPLRDVIQIEPAPKAGAHLVTAGIYARFRHPIYTGILMLVVGLFLRRPFPLVGLAGAAVTAFLIVKTRYEERLLLSAYPDYRAYKQRTWGLIPFSKG